MKRTAFALLVAATACEGTLPPLRKLGEVGKDPVVLFIGGDSGEGDLFAALPTGGDVIQVTFSPVAESRPSLSSPGWP